MREFLNRGAVCAVLLLAAPWASAQQVHVFSDGKPFAAVDEGNAARSRMPDERKARHPLGERPDAKAIAEAHAAAFLRCGLDESAYPPPKPPAPEELDYFVKDASFIPVAGSSKIIVIGEYGRGKALVDTAQHAVLTPQCPAGMRTMFWSHDTARVVFATQRVNKIVFHGDSQALWTASHDPAQDLYLLDTAHAQDGIHRLMTLPNEKVLDVALPDGGQHLWVLSQSESLDLRTPRNWLRALSRKPARKMDILLRKVDLQGKTLEQVTVARAVAAGSAQFVRE